LVGRGALVPVLDEGDDEVVVGAREAARPILSFIRGGGPKEGRNRLRIHLTPEDRDAEVERLVDTGVRHVDTGQSERSPVVLADPEGNEFCVLRSTGPGVPRAGG
jgi:hypothetical protein